MMFYHATAKKKIHHVLENVRYFTSSSAIIVPVTNAKNGIILPMILTSTPLERERSIARVKRYQKGLLP
jgi:hypothetical protein